MRNHNKTVLFTFILLFLFHIFSSSQSKAPFLPPDTIYSTSSQFQLNLIFNQNRNLPIIFTQYSKQFIHDYIYNLIQQSFIKQPQISLALLVDCRQFIYDLNNTLGICYGFDKNKAKQQEQQDKEKDQEKRYDKFFRFDFMTPNPSKIKEKGHLLSKNHDVQNLRQNNYQLSPEFLAKVIKNQIPDFITYIQDNYDMQDFLQSKNQFSFSKKPKLLFFDQNLQSPLFLKKLAARLQSTFKTGVTDDYKIAKKYNSFYDSILLMQYNFNTQNYQTTKIQFTQNNEMKDILNNQAIKRYLKLHKYRDIMLDFQHKQPVVYNMSTITEINQLMAYGRIIYLEVSEDQNNFKCQSITKIALKYSIFFNYICFAKDNIAALQKVKMDVQKTSGFIYIINKSLKDSIKVLFDEKIFNAHEYLPRLPPRQKVSATSEAQMCLKTAFASKLDPVFYWYNGKDHQNTLKLLQHFNSLPQVTSLIYFCQISVPDKDLIKQYQLEQNCLFSMKSLSKINELQKFQFRQALQFAPIKMFLRELSITQMTKVYEQKLSQNNLKQITSSEQLTKQCFNKDCIIGLIAKNKFRYEEELRILKEIKMEINQQGYNFVWIDGNCHWDVPKQLKLLQKNEKAIDRSYVFYYKQKNNQMALMKSQGTNKYWVKKDVKKWIKTLKQPNVVQRLKFGIDIEDKKCDKINAKQNLQPNQQRKPKRRNQKTVKQDQL